MRFTIILILINVLISLELSAQPWPFKKKSQVARATRDLERRQKDVGQGNAFNPLQHMGARQNFHRDDHLWTSETAFISTVNNGNISITTPSRLGISHKYELQSMLGASYWVPNLMLKRKISSGKWWFATRHGLYTPSPGLTWAKNRSYNSIVQPFIQIPHVFAIKNELIVSRPFYDPTACNTGQPYLILSGGLSADYSFPLSTNKLTHINEHYLGSRSSALTGQGLLIISRLRIDALISHKITLEGGVKHFYNHTNWKNGLEQHASINYFLSYNTTVSLGYILSYGEFATNNFAIIPLLDFTYYFGAKPRRPAGLFNQKMY